MSKNMKVWIAGANGQLGTALLKHLDCEEYHVLKTDMDIDIRQMEAVSRFAEMSRPNVVINCAAMTHMRRCEENRVEAYRINALGARNISAAARMVGAKIIQISTDDVFGSAKKGILTEFDQAEPTTVYGKSKLAGEMLVRELNPKHLVIRSSWLYGGGKDFVAELIHNVRAGKMVEAALDQISSPTSVDALAKCIICLMNSPEYGVYHIACKGKCSRYDFAKAVLEGLNMNTSLLKPVKLDELKAGDGSQRPLYTPLENLMLEMTGIYEMPDWKTALEDYLKELEVDA